MFLFRKKKTPLTVEQKRYRFKLGLKKFFLYLMWIAASVGMFITAYRLFDNNLAERVNPQIDRAIVRIADLLPQMEKDEKALRDAYGRMRSSWEEVLKSSDSISNEFFFEKIDANFEEVVGSTLSWLNRVTKFKVGQDGMVAVISKDDGKVIAHPNKELVGGNFILLRDLNGEDSNVIPVESAAKLASSGELDSRYTLMFPRTFTADTKSSSLEMGLMAIFRGVYGGVLAYNDYYILCGISANEFILSVWANASLVTMIFMVLMWLFVRWICLVMDTHKEQFKSMRNKLFSYTALLCVLLLGVTYYIQVLNTVTSDLKTMSRHAHLAVDTLNSYEEQRTKLNRFLDDFYLIQCKLASALIEQDKAENLTWKDMQHYADLLQVKYIYLFDRDGKVVVTNSPYDQLTASDDPENFTYQFRRVLEGLEYLVMSPLQDDWRNEYIQYVALSLRDEENLSNGFVLIGVDPSLRDKLLKPLNVNTVLENLVIGLPEEALAVNKETLKIEATTGIGYKGSSIEELGLTPDMLANDYTGFLTINGTQYYAGVATASQYYLIPLMQRPGNLGPLLISLKLALAALIASMLVILLTLIRYQKLVLDSVPEEELKSADEPEEEEVPDERAPNLFSGLSSRFSNLLPQQEKKGLKERWGVIVSKDKMTPEKRIGKYIYWILLLFCLLILLPTLLENLNGRADPNSLSNLAYVISGNWQKGINIFAFTTCIFLLCAMYVVVVLLHQLLYHIAKVSDMRVETFCLLIKNASKYICVIIFIYYGLAQFGVQTQTLLASAGILSMMISFGAKDLVSDIIAGFFTIIEGTYKVGDFIKIGTWAGTVVEIGLRTTKVRSFSETKVLNNSSIREIINSDNETTAAMTVPISYETDLMEVEAILDEELPKLKDSIPGLIKEPSYDGVDSLGENSVNLRISMRVKSSSRGPALRRLTREIKLLFDRRGIEIPYNQLVLHNAKIAAKETADQEKESKKDQP